MKCIELFVVLVHDEYIFNQIEYGVADSLIRFINVSVWVTSIAKSISDILAALIWGYIVFEYIIVILIIKREKNYEAPLLLYEMANNGSIA